MTGDEFINTKNSFSLKDYCKKNFEYKDHNTYIYIKCPFHNDKNPSLEVHDKYARCRAGCAPVSGNEVYDAVDFIKETQNFSTNKAMKFIEDNVGSFKGFSTEERSHSTTPISGDILQQIYNIAQKKLDLAHNYLFIDRKITKPDILPTNLGFIERGDLDQLTGIPKIIRENNAFLAPMYDQNIQEIIGLYFRIIDSNIKHYNYGRVGLWLPEINDTICIPDDSTWFAESVTDTFLTMTIDNNYNVCAVFSCSNFPNDSLLIIDSDQASLQESRKRDPIKIRVGDAKDHAESTRYIEFFTKEFDTTKILTSILLYEQDILTITSILPYIFVLANNNFLAYCMAYTLRYADMDAYSYLMKTIITMQGSALFTKKLDKEESFFLQSVKKDELIIAPFELEKELLELFRLYEKNKFDVLHQIEAFVASEKTSSIFNKKLIVENSINLKFATTHEQKSKPIIACGLAYCTRGDVHILAGHTGKGKTSIAMKMVENILAAYPRDTCKICYISFELTATELLAKMNGKHLDRLFILESLDYSITKKMKHYIHFILSKIASQGYNIVFIDHLGFLSSSEDGQWLETVMQQIKTICHNKQITAICLAQFVKGRADSTKGYFAAMDDIIGGSWINTIASSIWIIQEFERVIINKKQEYKRYHHICQAKCRAKLPDASYPDSINFNEFFNKKN